MIGPGRSFIFLFFGRSIRECFIIAQGRVGKEVTA